MYLILMLLLGADAGPMRCDDALVQTGATTLEVLSKCGEPDWRERVSGLDEPAETIWIYSRPASGEQKLLHFKGATLEAIRNVGLDAGKYQQSGTFRCGDAVVKTGSTKLDVSRYCGKPGDTRRISSSEETLREIWLYQRDGNIVELEFEGVELRRVQRHMD